MISSDALLQKIRETRHDWPAQRIALLEAECGSDWPTRLWDLVRAGHLPLWDEIPSEYDEDAEDDVQIADKQLLEVLVEGLRKDPSAASAVDVAALLRRTPWENFSRVSESVAPGWPVWAHELVLTILGREGKARAMLERGAPLVVRRGIGVAVLELGLGTSDDDPVAALLSCARAALVERVPDVFARAARLGASPSELVDAAASAAEGLPTPPDWYQRLPFLRRASIEQARRLVLGCCGDPEPWFAVVELADSQLTAEEWLALARERLEVPLSGAAEISELCAIACLARTPSGSPPLSELDGYLVFHAHTGRRESYVRLLASLGADRLNGRLRSFGALEERGAGYALAALASLRRIDEEERGLVRAWAQQMLVRRQGLGEKSDTLAIAGPVVVPILDELRRSCTDNLERRALELGALGALVHGLAEGQALEEADDARLLYSEDLANAGAARFYTLLWRALPVERLDLVLEIVEESATSPMKTYLAHHPELLVFFDERVARRS